MRERERERVTWVHGRAESGQVSVVSGQLQPGEKGTLPDAHPGLWRPPAGPGPLLVHSTWEGEDRREERRVGRRIGKERTGERRVGRRIGKERTGERRGE